MRGGPEAGLADSVAVSAAAGARPRALLGLTQALSKWSACNSVRSTLKYLNLNLALPSRRQAAGVSRDSWHKRHETGARGSPPQEARIRAGAPAASTEIGPRRTHRAHVWGGSKESPASSLDVGNFSGGSECCVHTAGIADVVCSASNNQLAGTRDPQKAPHCAQRQPPCRRRCASRCAPAWAARRGPSRLLKRKGF